MIKDVFENSKEPLFARATAKLIIKPFEVRVLKEILCGTTTNLMETILDYLMARISGG